MLGGTEEKHDKGQSGVPAEIFTRKLQDKKKGF
jgi:hypothetical protein